MLPQQGMKIMVILYKFETKYTIVVVSPLKAMSSDGWSR